MIVSNNADRTALAAAVCVVVGKYGGTTTYETKLPQTPYPSAPRAWLIAVIVALGKALEKASEMNRGPRMDVKIFTSSSYAIDSMTTRRAWLIREDFVSHTGALVSNRDLLREAFDKLDDLEQLGTVEFILVSKTETHGADGELEDSLDRMEQQG